MNEMISRSLKCVLTEAEVLAHGRELARLGSELAAVDDEKKEVVAQFKAKSETLQALINREAQLVNNGYEYRPTECRVVMNEPAPGKKMIIRTDTGETVEILKMTSDDSQTALEFANGE